MKRITTMIKGLLISSVLLLPSIVLTSTVNADGYASGVGESSLLAGSNTQRAAAGVGSLHLNSELDAAAQAKANDMVSQDYWSHYAPSGTTPWDFIRNAGYHFKAAGENLAYGFDTSSDVITGWMNSTEHRANLLNAGYVDVGFGIANSPDFVGAGPETIIVAEYGTPLVAASQAPASTTPRTTLAPPTHAAPTQNSPSAPADTAVAAASTASAQAKVRATKVVTKHQVSQPSWLARLLDGNFIRSTHLSLSSPAVRSSLLATTTVLAVSLAVIGQTVLPTRLR